VDLRTQTVAFPAAVEAASKGEHHLAPMTYASSDPSVLELTFLSSNADAGFNWAKIRDAELDQLLKDGVREQDPVRRTEIYARAQQIIMDQAVLLPIRDYVNINVAGATVQGLRYDPRGWFPWLYDVYLTREASE
jgi:peptide/nickel transport system substrate-binding protein